MGAKAPVVVPDVAPPGDGLKGYFKGKIEELDLMIKDKAHNLRRLEAQRNELNTQGVRRLLSLPRE
jgi:26S proteasome regulatory subunit T6